MSVKRKTSLRKFYSNEDLKNSHKCITKWKMYPEFSKIAFISDKVEDCIH